MSVWGRGALDPVILELAAYFNSFVLLIHKFYTNRRKLPPLIEKLKKIGEQELKELEKQMDKAGAPWTPDRVPDWK